MGKEHYKIPVKNPFCTFLNVFFMAATAFLAEKMKKF